MAAELKGLRWDRRKSVNYWAEMKQSLSWTESITSSMHVKEGFVFHYAIPRSFEKHICSGADE